MGASSTIWKRMQETAGLIERRLRCRPRKASFAFTRCGDKAAARARRPQAKVGMSSIDFKPFLLSLSLFCSLFKLTNLISLRHLGFHTFSCSYQKFMYESKLIENFTFHPLPHPTTPRNCFVSVSKLDETEFLGNGVRKSRIGCRRTSRMRSRTKSIAAR